MTTTKTLPKPSDTLKPLIDNELKLPKYQGQDEDIAIIDALQSIIKAHGPTVFMPFNTTDQILLRLATDSN